MIKEKTIEELCLRGESVLLDYKSEQYKFEGCNDSCKSELLKDILSFSNAWRDEKAYILIGVSEKNGQGEIVGIQPSEIIDDSKIQQFVNSKTNRNIPFATYSVECKNRIVQVLEIEECANDRPFYINKDFGNVKKNVVKIRRGTSTNDAPPDEVVQMVEKKFLEKQPMLEAFISPVGSGDYSKEGITLCAIDIDFENQHFQDYPTRLLSTLGPSPQAKQNWIKECFSTCGISLKLKNISDVQATDLRIETEIMNASVNIDRLDDYPSKPENYGLILPNISSEHFINGDVSIRPQDSYLEDKCVYLKAEDSGTADFIVSVYGQNLSKPLIFTFKLQFIVGKKTFPSEYLNDKYWDGLEEDSIFEFIYNWETKEGF